MNKRFLLPCLGLLCSLGSFAYDKGDYVFTPEQRLKITGDQNLVVNGDFSSQSPSDANFGWKAADGTNLSTELWTISPDGGVNGKGAVISQSDDAAATMYQAVPFTPGQTLMVSFKVKASDAGAFSTSTSAGSLNYIDVYANTDGSASKTAARFQQVGSSVAIAESGWTDVTFCFKDTVSGGSVGNVVISLGRLPVGTTVSDFEVKEAQEVFDTRIADRAYKYIDYLLESGKFPETQEEFKEGYEYLKETLAETDAIGDAEDLLSQIITLRNDWLDNNSTELIKYVNRWDITAQGKYNNKDLKTLGDWVFEGGRWGHVKGAENFTSSIPGNYAFDKQTCMIQRAVGAPFTVDNDFLFSMEGEAQNYFKTKVDGSWYAVNYGEAVDPVKMFVGNDTITWDNVSDRAYAQFGAIGHLPADAEKLIVGIQFASFGDHGGWVSCKNPSLRIIGYSETQIKRAAYINDVYVQQKALIERLDDSRDKIADSQRPWGKEALQDSVNLYQPLYEQSLTYVDADGKDLKNAEMPEEGYDATLLAAVKAMNSARNNFSKINAPFTDIVATIAMAEETKELRIYSESTKKAELNAAIASAQALHDAKLTTAFNSEDSLALVNENTALKAAIEAYKVAIPETAVVDIDFGTQENPIAIKERSEGEGDDAVLTYYIPGAKGEMVLSDSTVCELGYQKTDSLGMLHFGNMEGTVKFEGAPAKATDIVKFSFDYYFGSLITKNAGWYIKDADGNDIAGLYISKYSGTSVTNTFDVNYNSNITGVGSSSASNAAIAAASNRTHFDVVLDYGKGKMYCQTSGSKGTFTSDEVDLNQEQTPASFVLKSDYNNTDRRCWFDNLKISNIAAGKYDGIFSVDSDKTEVKDNNVKYNIAGQRIMTPAKGQIYIMNGKKYMGK